MRFVSYKSGILGRNPHMGDAMFIADNPQPVKKA